MTLSLLNSTRHHLVLPNVFVVRNVFTCQTLWPLEPLTCTIKCNKNHWAWLRAHAHGRTSRFIHSGVSQLVRLVFTSMVSNIISTNPLCVSIEYIIVSLFIIILKESVFVTRVAHWEPYDCSYGLDNYHGILYTNHDTFTQAWSAFFKIMAPPFPSKSSRTFMTWLCFGCL